MEESSKCDCWGVNKDGEPCPSPTVGDSNYCTQHGDWFEADLRIFDSLTNHFRQDVREFWTRSNLYLLVEGVMASVFVTTVTDPDRAKHLLILVFISTFGLALTTSWYLVARSSIIWIDRWRDQVLRIGKVVDRHRAYETVHLTAQSTKPWHHPQRMTLYLILLFALSWTAGLVALTTITLTR